MFSINNYWLLALLFAVVFTIAIIGRRKTKDLPPQEKVLRQLFYLLLSLFIVNLFLMVSLPDFSGVEYVTQEIKSLEEAQTALRAQDQSIRTMRENLSELKSALFLLFLFIVPGLIDAIYKVSRAITPSTKEKVLDPSGE